jgi:hypothetical protein
MSPNVVVAHGVGRVYESPIPLSAYLLGAAATVLVSFVVASLRSGNLQARAERQILGPRPARIAGFVLGVLALLLLGVGLIAGLVVSSEGFTFTTLAFWVALIVGVTAVSALIGGAWELLDPWARIEGFYRLEETQPGSTEPPWWVGPLLLYGLFWFELVSGAGFQDRWVFAVVLAYSMFVFTMRAQLGDRWREVDPLSILFGFASRCAPLRISNEGVFYKGPVRDLLVTSPMPRSLFASILVLLASTTLDNVVETVAWTNLRADLGIAEASDMLVDSVALLAFTVPFLATFGAAIWVAHRWIARDRPFAYVARIFGWSLVPIGVAYVLAHNAPLLMTGLPQLLRTMSDPFDMGWNLLGTASLFEGFSPSPQLVWFLEIAFIVGGHILGVLAAHYTAVRLAARHSDAVKSQYALTILMSLYTIATLWLLSQPLVA